MSAIILQNEIVHYEVLGRGRPIIFLHGWVGSWRYWIPAMQSASVGFRTYSLDFWGFGDTAKNPGRYLLQDQLAMVQVFLEQMGIGKVAIIGHGLGAVVAMMYAYRYSNGVDRVMAVSAPVGSLSINGRLRVDTPQEMAEWLLVRSQSTEPVRLEAPKTDPMAIKVSLSDLDSIDLLDLGNQMKIPCLLVHGQNDPAVISNNADPLSIDLPDHAHFILFDESGHFPMLDEQSKFNRLMSDFLNLKSGESPRQLQLRDEWKRRVR